MEDKLQLILLSISTTYRGWFQAGGVVSGTDFRRSGTRFFRSLFPRTSAVCAIRKIIGKKSHSASECLIEEHFLDIIQAQVARMRLGYGMKRTWDIEELIEYFTLVPPELELLGNKTGATRLNFALLLKCFQREDIA